MKVNLFTDIFDEEEPKKTDLRDWYNEYDPDWKPVFGFRRFGKLLRFLMFLSWVLVIGGCSVVIGSEVVRMITQ